MPADPKLTPEERTANVLLSLSDKPYPGSRAWYAACAGFAAAIRDAETAARNAVLVEAVKRLEDLADDIAPHHAHRALALEEAASIVASLTEPPGMRPPGRPRPTGD